MEYAKNKFGVNCWMLSGFKKWILSLIGLERRNLTPAQQLTFELARGKKKGIEVSDGTGFSLYHLNRNQKKEIGFLTNARYENEVAGKTNLYLQKSSILRKLGRTSKEESDEVELKTSAAYVKDTTVYRQITGTAALTSTHYTFSLIAQDFESQEELDLYARLAGKFLATYENGIFLLMLEMAAGAAPVELTSSDLAETYRAFHILKQNGAERVVCVLADMYRESFTALKEEVIGNLNIQPEVIFVPDEMLMERGIRAIVIERAEELDVQLLQPAPIAQTGIKVGDQKLLQTSIPAAYFLSGVKSSCICTLTKDTPEFELQ